MFKKILVPIDGSPLARNAAKAAVELARLLHAEIVAFEVVPRYIMHVLEDTMVAPGMLSEDEFNSQIAQRSTKHLGEIDEIARAAGVPFNGTTASSEQTAAAIVDAAKTNGCDLIFMGSHGRSNIAQIFLGGVTTKVLSMTALPVMVHRGGA
jgi:nucleotide-binding universal stress UspA family protein